MSPGGRKGADLAARIPVPGPALHTPPLGITISPAQQEEPTDSWKSPSNGASTVLSPAQGPAPVACFPDFSELRHFIKACLRGTLSYYQHDAHTPATRAIHRSLAHSARHTHLCKFTSPEPLSAILSSTRSFTRYALSRPCSRCWGQSQKSLLTSRGELGENRAHHTKAAMEQT